MSDEKVASYGPPQSLFESNDISNENLSFFQLIPTSGIP